MITGAAGSIGSELARQVSRHGPGTLVLFDQAETDLFYLEMELRETRATAAAVEASAGHLGSLEERWLIARAALVLLALALAVALAVAAAAVREYRRAERYARSLARELDGKRQAALAERQESARRILDLEAQLSTLAAQRGPRVVIGGRGG